MTKKYQEITASISASLGELRKLQPEAMQGFSALAAGAKKDNFLDKKTKELVALGIAVTARCDGCIGFHIKELISLGATKDEISDVLAMCIYMGGGPAAMYAADALKAFSEFSSK